jgi:hypothetical protein
MVKPQGYLPIVRSVTSVHSGVQKRCYDLDSRSPPSRGHASFSKNDEAVASCGELD